ncbi:MAG: DUF1570 domain-containing protein [Planctomycetota bacterium]|nr:MAG: DUF1570 domain-containing protein [Planctomycetota bacterium]
MSTRSGPLSLIAVVMIGAAHANLAQSADELVRVTFTDKATEQERSLAGRILVEAADGGLLVEDRSRELWTVTPDQLLSRETLAGEFQPFGGEELGRHLLAQHGDAFTLVETEHYAICTSAGAAYSEWVGKLFERLQRAFLDTWQRAGLELHEPQAPLPAIVFRTKQEYAEFAARDAGPQLADAAGYYSIRTNRIVLYDLTSEAGGASSRSANEIERRLRASPENVATIVHEATHQIAFNCGMHTRYADNPMWLLEGIAMYCETPDLRSGSGWKAIGKLNLPRLNRFRRFSEASRRDDSLLSLIVNEDRFRDPESVADAYAESWALTYFLIRNRREEMVAYLKALSSKPRLRWDSAEDRRQEFVDAFGNVSDLEEDFVRFIRRQGRR